MLARFVVLSFGVIGTFAQTSDVKSAEDLGRHYEEIFHTGNRNAASHLWTSFVLDRAADMPVEQLGDVFKGFCAVSGSPIPDDPQTMYKVKLPRVGGGTVTGVMRHCCWPCICDATDFVRVDTKKVKTQDGTHSFDFLVIGDPCKNPGKLQSQFQDPFSKENISLLDAAPELRCKDEKLVDAVYSDHGYPIIGMLFTSEKDIAAVPEKKLPMSVSDPTYGFSGMCQVRQKMGYNSGMGLIFHLVAKINPIPDSPPLALPPLDQNMVNQFIEQVEESPDHCFRSLAQQAGLLGQHFIAGYFMALVIVLGIAITGIRFVRRGQREKQEGLEMSAILE